eukprot:TRINITY_DN3063_c0_g1_i1.p1 TRINITY_DN3063_c0_g1~~TRINITY_DN3063_c0_g1_i1.p1  ORF type:complete len:280 (-),score=28.78 TRINITY_DN3063_c0_g1_i1:107-946(-)
MNTEPSQSTTPSRSGPKRSPPLSRKRKKKQQENHVAKKKPRFRKQKMGFRNVSPLSSPNHSPSFSSRMNQSTLNSSGNSSSGGGAVFKENIHVPAAHAHRTPQPGGDRNQLNSVLNYSPTETAHSKPQAIRKNIISHQPRQKPSGIYKHSSVPRTQRTIPQRKPLSSSSTFARPKGSNVGESFAMPRPKKRSSDGSQRREYSRSSSRSSDRNETAVDKKKYNALEKKYKDTVDKWVITKKERAALIKQNKKLHTQNAEWKAEDPGSFRVGQPDSSHAKK